MAKVSVLGAGGWGLALALSAFHNKNEVLVWSCFEEEIKNLKNDREHKKLLPGIKIPEEIKLTTDINEVNGSDITIIAVPSVAVRVTAGKLKGIDCGIVVDVAKGMEADTHKTLSEVIADCLPDRKIVVLSGPSHAEEVGRKIPTTLVAASHDIEAAETVQNIMMSEFLRIYTNTDVLGVELGGALKNVIAVAAGIIDGLSGLGDNTKAALITRGISEIARLGVSLGASHKTFMGLSGLGDLIVTCNSVHSRNHRYGEKIGMGISPDVALAEVGTVEGYYACAVVHKFAKEKQVDMPICEQCYEIIYNGKSPKNSIFDLMTRPQKQEQNDNLWG